MASQVLRLSLLQIWSKHNAKRLSGHFSAIAKFARFHREIRYYIAETQAHEWIDGHKIGPAFLGYLTEENRVIGSLVEKIDGQHATVSDLPACETTVRKLHGLGILHGDLHRHNFLISEKRAFLIDFETAKQFVNREAMQREVESLESQLLDEPGIDGEYHDDADIGVPTTK